MKLFFLVLCIGFVVALPDEENGTCTPGENWSNDCNTCFCPDNGLLKNSGCTLIGCLKSTTCTPGDKWKKDCNDCFCNKRGNEICTVKKC